MRIKEKKWENQGGLGEDGENKKVGKSILSPFRCEECPLLEDEEDISDEEMEQLVIIFRNICSCFFEILRDPKSYEFEPENNLAPSEHGCSLILFLVL